MGKKNEDRKETRYCPFKKAVSTENNGYTGRKELHERFEECAGERCMAYLPGGRCRRLEGGNGTR